MKCKGQKQFQLMNLTQLASQNIQTNPMDTCNY